MTVAQREKRVDEKAFELSIMYHEKNGLSFADFACWHIAQVEEMETTIKHHEIAITKLQQENDNLKSLISHIPST